MEKIFDKISQYNIINYIFPGTVFSVLVKSIGSINLIQENLFIALFFYYFVGLVISRMGSLIIEPLFKALKFVVYRKYPLYLKASKKDSKIDTLVEINNMYRTMVSLFAFITIYRSANCVLHKLNANPTIIEIATLVGLFVLFAFSFRKQTKYIIERIDNVNNAEKGEK